jgi:hypothetical protein
MRVRSIVVGAFGLLAIAVAATVPASAATLTNRWTVVPAAKVSRDATLAAVAAVSPTNQWAVGSLVGPGFPDPHAPLIEHNTGAGWRLVSTPSVGPAGGDLRAVTVVSAHDIWAVGSAGGKPLALHYDGTRWKVVAVAPNPAGEEPGGDLRAVAAVSAHDVWAVGSRPTGDGPGILVQHWDGHHWSFVAAPSQAPTDFNALTGLAVVSAHDIWAVGSRGDDFNEPMVEHWDGKAWRVVSVPEPPQADPDDPKNVGLVAVTAVSATNVWAVGEAGLVEHYDGHHWTIVSAPRPPADTDGMGTTWSAVSARGAKDIWAVGSVSGNPVSMHWNGTVWKLVAVPGAGVLSGVVAVHNSGTTAVGTRSTKALILRNDR